MMETGLIEAKKCAAKLRKISKMGTPSNCDRDMLRFLGARFVQAPAQAISDLGDPPSLKSFQFQGVPLQISIAMS